MWSQGYDPFGNSIVSTFLAAVPVVVLLGCIAFLKMKAHVAALLGIASSLAIAILAFGMPTGMATRAAAFGAAYGLMPIGWIILNVIFLYRLTEQRGQFRILQDSIAGVTPDRRLQLLLIAFGFGAFFEGAAGFGTPVAVTGAMLIGLGFSPLAASGLSLIANTAPVAFGALGTPVIALASVTGLDLHELSGMVGRQLPFFSIIVPFWLIWAFAGWRGMVQVWPAIAVAGVAFAIPQYLVSNFHGPWLVDIIAALCSMGALTLFLRLWRPASIWHSTNRGEPDGTVATESAAATHTSEQVFKAWLPWIVLSVCVFLWGIPQVKAWLDSLFIIKLPVGGLHELVQKVPPVVAAPTAEAAVYNFNILSMTGTGILVASILSSVLMKFSLREFVREYFQTLVVVRLSLLTIAAMLALGYVTRYSGADATMGLAFAQTGWLYPLFGTMLGWLGVALTGSDTASNVLFGGLQRITSEQLGLNPVLMAAANSSGGVMGKMIDAQSIVVASTATRWYGHESEILRYVFFHSIALALLVSLLVLGQAYVWPLTTLVH
ncbi:L-lactate permease [Steroidobacter agaridevorans]|uniref:L-lactate permease n=1 Tax=Steroidobacter agaridevorans TaxID=2695856 RepID=A0A829Y9Q6_9GAMM|nr:L-lactate permease [Steroidobacter agaridevorans]GFE79466.1 L-lactate permease [Steroidobacter agaridevorans]